MEMEEHVYVRNKLTHSSDVTLDGLLRELRRLSPRLGRPRLPHRGTQEAGRLDSMCMEH